MSAVDPNNPGPVTDRHGSKSCGVCGGDLSQMRRDAKYCSDACRTVAKRAREQEAADQAAAAQARVSSDIAGLGTRLDQLDEKLAPILDRWQWLMVVVKGWMPILDGPENGPPLDARVSSVEYHHQRHVGELRRRTEALEDELGRLRNRLREMEADDTTEVHLHRQLRKVNGRVGTLEARLSELTTLTTRIVDAMAERGAPWS